MELTPGYKQTEVGVIPAEWEVKPLGELGQFKNGINKGKEDFGHGFPFVNLMDVFGIPKVSTEANFGLVSSSSAERKLYELKRGDVLFVRSSVKPEGVGLTTLIPADLPDTVFSGFLIRYRDNDQLALEFKEHCFWQAGFRSRLVANSTVSANTNINQDSLKALQIAFPPNKDEQRAIAGALGEVDGLIGALDRLIAKKRDTKQATMQQLLTGQRRLTGFHADWKVVRFEDIADRTIPWSIAGGPFGSNLKASDYLPEGVRIIQLQNIGDGRFHDEYAIYTSEAKADELLSNNIYPGEIILSKMGDPVARACFVPSADRRYLMASDGIRLAVDSCRFDKRFVHDYINSSYFRKKAIEASTGSTRQRIGLVDLKQLPFVAPPLSEQTAIAAVFSDMDAEIAALEARRNKTRALKQGMMQELLTGRTRLV